ncbi:MAG: hypothetical protein IJV24_07295 [Prevotella sp.]|nr:hypothetical protein [Prevotella sp.]
MSKVKYRVREFTPTANQGGTHSFYAEAVINTDITAVELAKKIAARTGMKSYEASAAIHAIADIVAEETLEGSRVSLANEDGTKLVTIYPKVSGSISDKDVQANPQKYGGAQAATEDMLTPDLLQWTLGATIGTKYSKQFALNKQAQKVKFVASDVTAEPEAEGQTGGPGSGSSSADDPGNEGD